MLDLLSVIGLDGYFKRINPVFTQTLGRSEAEFLANPFLDFVHPDDHSATLAEMEKLKAGAPTLKFENRYQTIDGGYRWLEWRASSQIDRGLIYCVARDITQQKETETALKRANKELERRTVQLEQVNASLRESEERNQLAMEIARMYTFEWEVATDAVKRSPHCADILGLNLPSAEQETGAVFFQRIHPDDRTRFIAGLQALTPENSTYRTTYRVVRPDGQILILEEIGSALFNQQGQLTRLIGITADVTERQRLEAELEESRTTLQRQLAEIETIYQSAPIGLNFLDTDLRFVRINQRLAEINGFSVEEHIGRTIRELLPDLADTAEALLNPILETGKPLLNIEIRGETPAQPGVERIWLESFLPLKDGERVIGINTVCEEITERKQAEAQRENLLQQEQATREAAERANRMKDEFLAILSHELRTPLNPILGWTKILQSPKVTSDKLQMGLSTIERNAKQQVQLIEDLLDISHIIHGKLSLNFAAIDLSEPIRAALETVHLAAQAKAIGLEVVLDPSVDQVRGDAGRLQQVIWNLLSNAIKFTPTGGLVTVQLTCVDHHAQIQVSDTGKGIQPEFLPHVFELFQQQDSSTTRSFGGLGLGLAISRQLVEAHGGTITVASAGEGQGAKFTVQLPLIPVSHSHTPDSFNDQTVDLNNLRVIVVDDEADSLELVKVLLEQEGTVVQVVSSATKALSVLTQAQFDLLISDIGMPEMDGYTFIRQVRTLPPQFNRDIPAIALTAYAGETNQRQILSAGFQIHLAKPIEPQRLLDVISTLITPS
ncbi:PAS domain S-box protein [Nostoc parmelioides FACHB-3921]|uniref:histidine kinase n=2 Tax=Nostoc TaxID=1177 RepID=A0ABR8BQV6_9NOSO|nr:PAS domain S-box protein [Nostoc parmelioides]MBD2255667.1 PAS domain S-box protein [Nostoc parmelioides FACHB-3921]